MYEELNISESEGVWAAYNAVCDLKEETERLQAACAAKTAELAELREQTAELFAERVAAEGADEEAVHAAMAMWVSDPQSAAQAVLGCDITEAANPYGCNQYGHEWKGKHGEGWKPSGRGGASDKKEAAPEKKEDTQPKREAESPKEKSIEEEADEYENGSDKERGLKLFIWKRDLRQAKDKALDIRESTKYRQRDPETVKQYEEAKKDANERAKRLRSTLKAIGERRGWDKKKIDYMLRNYPETVIDF